MDFSGMAQTAYLFVIYAIIQVRAMCLALSHYLH